MTMKMIQTKTTKVWLTFHQAVPNRPTLALPQAQIVQQTMDLVIRREKNRVLIITEQNFVQEVQVLVVVINHKTM